MSLRTPFCEIHEQLGARMVDFAGWRMPLLYTSIIAEHHHTRSAASIFDVSHMGRLILTGGDAEALIERCVTRKVSDQPTGRVRYGLVCNAGGGALDDVLVYRYEKHWMIVCNASNRERIVNWLTAQAEGLDARLDDQTQQTAMVAVQGPSAVGLIDAILPDAGVAKLKRYAFLSGDFMGMSYTVSRTGYTGEDGVEAIFPASAAGLLWQYLGSGSASDTLKPAGLGARDTLRLEAGMPLYGHELDTEHGPVAAGLDFAVSLDKEFIGRDALARQGEQGVERKLVGLTMPGRKAARQGYAVLADDKPIGVVTSGTLSPTLGFPIAMAYVEPGHAAVGARLAVDVRGDRIEATVVKLPFYKAK